MEQSNLLPLGCIVRRATSEDAWSIRLLVFSAKLDPTQLRWQQFWVIECEGKLVACGQLRSFSDAQELGSLVVAPSWRNRGLGIFLTQHLIRQATQPLYLECLGQQLAKFYTRFGFVPISIEDVPPSLKRKFGFSNLGKKLLAIPVVFMEYRSNS
ncbi:GNAT family N-acetyltransferase [Aetokthonos hydrillicola Thurmond2011]|jgi:amino-acid N-acetyltransferase|uniref:GNAT family N-acetyltransferase n=1 Tax=Aetokthonos hydrillicola Thurmond2011 TaxID=2712845 RepID=A0AAP5M3G2_9CYAN|nr:GNAT family N-acetyltransferase [Aetokthonos hydrillicola]MBO3457456.1 GNAT family N-acetyltransferase [Aetokthonos hydrillicola CCALA 1050]MBW4586023.1 GNAT family N-acetyltransferase [Aetokthonos hydrillicola CCALA 1050]MDR9893751.1 GNAT family N-acetyltransferase [Aetokthonos hydrillicola Thurmond2011]